MRRVLFLFFVAVNLIFGQVSDWQVYKIPYKNADGTYAFCDNTGTGPFMIWWKRNVGFNYSSMPQIIRTGIDYSISTQAWGGQSYLSFTTGNDVQTVARFNETRDYFAAGELINYDSQSGQINIGEIEANMGKYNYQGVPYDLVWNTNGNSYIDNINHMIYLDSRAEMAHEVGHVLGIFHTKVGSNGETMSTFSQAQNAGINPAQRMFLKSNDWAALGLLYNKLPISSVVLLGDATLYSGYTGHWWVAVENGRPAFTYNWQIMYLDGAGYLQSFDSVVKEKEKRDKVKDKIKDGNIIIDAVPSNEWVPVGTNSSSFSKTHNPYDLRDFKLRCIVTDLNNSTGTSNEFYVDVVSYPPPSPSVVNGNLRSETISLLNEDEPSSKLTNYFEDQNYPNPFNPSTNIRYELPQSSFVTLKVYNILGEEVAALVNKNESAGIHEANFDASRFTSGVYIYTLNAGDFVQSKKMMLLK
ncbi:MAG: T9SS type A sorting domain-containing protein [Bacteroidetes bacterium]|nr:T9SS type A sorting domain-containing protein [Bacteroidota bacterium]